ncbi:unnamed protein product [Euphydryas editha]|uniref:Reverse transcriptase n=1 Tax=Euphydryas editha TaxID=104508 RepID=A0AAU9U8G5_EUPED|nr:unnamed protein product [Euphydryas editha]
MTNNPKLISNIEVLNIQFPSDHRLLRATVPLNFPIKSRKAFGTLLTISKTDIEIKKYNAYLETSINSKKEKTNIQTYYNFLEESIKHSLKSCKETKQEQHKIFSEETIRLIKRRTELTHKKNKTKESKQELTRIYKEANRSIRKDYCKHRQEVITRNIINFRSTKRAYKELTTHKTWIEKLERNSEETKSRKDVVNHATSFYNYLYRKRNNNEIETVDEHPSNSIKPIENSEVYEHIKRLKVEKSPGPDGLCNEALKIGAPTLTQHLSQLFNMVLDTETVPSQWCNSDIILIFKKSNPLDIGAIMDLTSDFKTAISDDITDLMTSINDEELILMSVKPLSVELV